MERNIVIYLFKVNAKQNQNKIKDATYKKACSLKRFHYHIGRAFAQ